MIQHLKCASSSFNFAFVQALLNEKSLIKFLNDNLKSLGTSGMYSSIACATLPHFASDSVSTISLGIGDRRHICGDHAQDGEDGQHQVLRRPAHQVA